MSEKTIKNCPFCGAGPIDLEWKEVAEDEQESVGCVGCMSCDADGPLVAITAEEEPDEVKRSSECMDEAYRKWNRRTP